MKQACSFYRIGRFQSCHRAAHHRIYLHRAMLLVKLNREGARCASILSGTMSYRRTPRFEPLEDRRLLALVTVN
jgi:hypothetical protein